MVVTIGMVTYNRLDLTKQTFERALKNTGKKYNLIICDNNSTDGTLDWLNEKKDLPEELENMIVVPLKKNHGVAYGRNICLKTMKEQFKDTKYICTLDNDVAIPNKNWLKDCCDVLDANQKIGCCAINYESKSFPQTTIKTLDGRLIKVKIIINTPGTATTVFPIEIFEKIGYFKRYGNGVYGHEDADMWVRVRHLNKMLLYLDEPGIHLGEGDNDVGEYRKMKTQQFNKYRPEFVKDLQRYSRGATLYIDFQEEIDG